MEEGRHHPLFVVTTRSRLRGPWRFPQMMIASLRIRRQLASTGDVVRWASIVAGPSEFWTITVWRSRHHMHEFMRSGAHDRIMWQFSRWLRSFWLMRWQPGPTEVGTWNGLTLAPPDGEGPDARLAEPARELSAALDHLPWLRAATGPDGAAGYETTPYARRRRAELSGAGGAIVCLRTSPLRTVGGVRRLHRIRRDVLRGGDAVRAVVGVGGPGESYLLALCPDRAAAQRVLGSPGVAEAARRWPQRCWANEWRPDNEFGHWDGLRLRRPRRTLPLDVPQAAFDAADGAGSAGAVPTPAARERGGST